MLSIALPHLTPTSNNFGAGTTYTHMEVVSRYHRSEDEILNEQQQVSLAKENPEKFDRLYEKYYEQIFRFTYQRLDSRDTAFDITQQVFLTAMLNLKKYEDRGVPFSAWLYRIALNELNKLFRKKQERTHPQCRNIIIGRHDDGNR